MIPTAVLMKLATLGLSEAQAEAVAGMLSTVEAATKGEADAVIEKSREKVRVRVQKWRAKQPVTLPNVTERYVTAHASAPPAPDLENNKTNKQGRKQDSEPQARGGLADFQAELSSILDAEHVEAICAVRRKKGATFSALAGRGLVKALRACPDINAAADEMVLRNWTGVKPDWLESRNRQNGHSPPAHQGDGYNAVLNGIINGKHDEHAGPTIDASFDRTDRGSTANLVQFDAFSKGYRP